MSEPTTPPEPLPFWIVAVPTVIEGEVMDLGDMRDVHDNTLRHSLNDVLSLMVGHRVRITIEVVGTPLP